MFLHRFILGRPKHVMVMKSAGLKRSPIDIEPLYKRLRPTRTSISIASSAKTHTHFRPSPPNQINGEHDIEWLNLATENSHYPRLRVAEESARSWYTGIVAFRQDMRDLAQEAIDNSKVPESPGQFLEVHMDMFPLIRVCRGFGSVGFR
ncbi:hypothetical protein N7530_006300 [Penicillium desertorum]|uniref:Uncharacterized protein n=1 Tax=Penicillium desertorum TaxID=1303715 RepID=A0A9X0BM49_9EURO|nr:hypothetical protein N7530_006300 [Penicillium desertorum]